VPIAIRPPQPAWSYCTKVLVNQSYRTLYAAVTYGRKNQPALTGAGSCHTKVQSLQFLALITIPSASSLPALGLTAIPMYTPTIKPNEPGRVMTNDVHDQLILAARLLLTPLFLIFGWRKLKDYSGTVSQIVQLGGPAPKLAAGVAIFMELPVAFAVAVGAFARPAALLLVIYTLGTALIGHRYWTLTGADRIESMDGFYKNLSIMGGFLLLYITGAGKYSIESVYGMTAR
jgi:putative oxidoreductase